MKPSKRKAKKKKKPDAAAASAPHQEAAAAAALDSSGEPSSPSETLTLAAVAALETESTSGCEASSTSAFTASSSGTSSAFSSSASTVSSSATGDERRDLAWLLDVFSSATIDQVDSAYRETGGDAFLAAGILGSTQDTQPSPPRPQPPPAPDPSTRDRSLGKKASRRSKKVCAASGMVSDVIGKDYTRPASSPVSAPNAWKGRDGLSASNEWKGGAGDGDAGRKNSVEEAEQFLCGMLGDNSELGMGVVRDVLVPVCSRTSGIGARSSLE